MFFFSRETICIVDSRDKRW